MDGYAFAAVLRVAPRAEAHASEMTAVVHVLSTVACLVVLALAIHIGREWRKLVRAERKAKADSGNLKAQIEKLLPDAERAVESPSALPADRALFLEKRDRFAELRTQMDGGKRPLPWDIMSRELSNIHFRLRMLRAPLTRRESVPAENGSGS